MTRYAAPNPPFVPARWHGGSQRPSLIVLHSTVSPCKPGGARATANFFAHEDGKTSAHYVVDSGASDHTVQCVGDHTVAWHCGYNTNSIGIEMCEYPDAKNKRRWDDRAHRALESNTARLVAQLCLAYGIPPYFAGRLRLLAWARAGKPARLGGVTTHALMSTTFHASTHWDPGAWRRFRFMRAVRRQVKAIKAGR